MPVPMEQIIPGAVFRFKTGLRRVKRLKPQTGPDGVMVDWEYADALPRRRNAGSLWGATFRVQAIELVPDPSLAGETRQLLPSRRTIACLEKPVDVTLTTRCPAKWVMVDMETGDFWRNDGQQFHRLSTQETSEVLDVARMSIASAAS